MEIFVLHLYEDRSGAEWAVLDEHGRLVATPAHGSLDTARAAVGTRRLVAMIPGTAVTLLAATLPRTSQARLRQIVPFALEDAVADEVTELFFAFGKRKDSGTTDVAVIARRELDAWLGTLQDAGLSPHALYADTAGVPDTPGTMNLLLEGPRIHARMAGHLPVVLDGVDLTSAFALLAAVAPETPARHVVVRYDAAAAQHHGAALHELKQQFPGSDIREADQGVWCVLASTLIQTPGIDLLQGQPRTATTDWMHQWRPWRFAACLLLATLLLGIAVRGAQYLSLSHGNAVLGTHVAETCARELGVPDQDRCAAALQGLLGASATSQTPRDGLLDLLASVAGAMQPGASIKALDYHDKILNVSVVAPNIAGLNQLVQAVGRVQNRVARIQSTTPSGSAVEGQLEIREQKP